MSKSKRHRAIIWARLGFKTKVGNDVLFFSRLKDVGICDHCGKRDTFTNNPYLKKYGVCDPDCYEKRYV